MKNYEKIDKEVFGASQEELDQWEKESTEMLKTIRKRKRLHDILTTIIIIVLIGVLGFILFTTRTGFFFNQNL